ncbi:MAG: aminotransferase class V-fold PLP-dependent enzyme [Bacilli bacterium]|nr:aminotransferase class V-fold PLP-dependent enzyme [Bacilli bacterium]
MIYLDNSATTYPKPEAVYIALDYANRNLAFNAGRGDYYQSKQAFKLIDETREHIASFIYAKKEQVTFTSSATESLNIIINGLEIKNGDNIYISPFEHNAIIRPLYNLKKSIDFNICILPFNSDMTLNEERLNNMFAIKNPAFVFVSQISNVTGLKLPYQKIFEMAKAYNSINVLDSAQSYGVLNPRKENSDFIVFAGHKSLYASFGIAGFVSVTNYKLKITKSGGNGSDSRNHDMPENNHERYESGSPNVVAIYGLKTSCEWLVNNNVLEHEEKLTRYLLSKLKTINKVSLYTPKNEDDILGIISFNIEGYSPDDVGDILYSEYGICVRTGFHCSPFVHELIKTVEIGGTVRVSVGAFNSERDIDVLIDALKTF